LTSFNLYKPPDYSRRFFKPSSRVDDHPACYLQEVRVRVETHFFEREPFSFTLRTIRKCRYRTERR